MKVFKCKMKDNRKQVLYYLQAGETALKALVCPGQYFVRTNTTLDKGKEKLLIFAKFFPAGLNDIEKM